MSQLFCFPVCARACDHTCLRFLARKPSHCHQTPKQSCHLRKVPPKHVGLCLRILEHIIGSASCLEIETWSTRDAGSLDALKTSGESCRGSSSLAAVTEYFLKTYYQSVCVYRVHYYTL